jgi:hypothetical protein
MRACSKRKTSHTYIFQQAHLQAQTQILIAHPEHPTTKQEKKNKTTKRNKNHLPASGVPYIAGLGCRLLETGIPGTAAYWPRDERKGGSLRADGGGMALST